MWPNQLPSFSCLSSFSPLSPPTPLSWFLRRFGPPRNARWTWHCPSRAGTFLQSCGSPWGSSPPAASPPAQERNRRLPHAHQLFSVTTSLSSLLCQLNKKSCHTYFKVSLKLQGLPGTHLTLEQGLETRWTGSPVVGRWQTRQAHEQALCCPVSHFRKEPEIWVFQ